MAAAVWAFGGAMGPNLSPARLPQVLARLYPSVPAHVLNSRFLRAGLFWGGWNQALELLKLPKLSELCRDGITGKSEQDLELDLEPEPEMNGNAERGGGAASLALAQCSCWLDVASCVSQPVMFVSATLILRP